MMYKIMMIQRSFILIIWTRFEDVQDAEDYWEEAQWGK